MPTYPFAKERYWITGPKSEVKFQHNQLHPLLHSNSSNLSEQRFTSIFTGRERYLENHKVRAEKYLPGVAYLELAREAGAISLENKITRLTDVTWAAPD